MASALLAVGGLPSLLQAAAINTLTLAEDAAATPITLTAAGTNYTVLTQPTKGSLAGLSGGAFTGTASGTFTPTANANGSDTFTFRTINADVSTTNTFTINITAVNDAPVAVIPVVETLAGRDWLARTNSGARAWQAVTTTGDGTGIAAVVDGGQIWLSPDAGDTWFARESNRNWQAIASSADGTKLVAAVDAGTLFTSTDGGATWNARDSVRNWKSVAVSADGTKMVAADYGGRLYTSVDTGATWTARATALPWYAVASSSNGSNLAAVVYGGGIYTSTDSGTNWVLRTTSGPAAGNKLWAAVASSSNGLKLVAAEVNGFIHTSTDGGTNWTAQAGSGARFWTSVASTSDGNELIASAYGGQLFTSADSGVTWVARDESRLWIAVAASNDGGDLIAVNDLGFVYTSFDVNAPATITVAEDSGAYTNATFFSTLNAGPNESEQSITNITVVADDTTLFSVQPAFTTNGVLTFTPATNKFGTAALTISAIRDSLGLSSVPSPTNKVLVRINNVSDAPTQGNISLTGLEDTVFTFATNSFASGYNQSHIDGSSARAAVSYTFETLPSLGTLKLSGAPLAANQSVPVASLGNLVFEPALNQSGSASFRISVSDGNLSSGTGTNAATVTLTLVADNDAPFAVSQVLSTLEDTALNITLNGTDPDNNTLTYSVSTPTGFKGSLSGTAPTITYTPPVNFSGTDSFTFTVNDGITNSASATVSITVVAVNDAPSLSNVFVAGTEDTAVVFNKAVFDAAYSDPVETNAFASLTIVSLPLSGTLNVGGTAATAGQVIAAADLGTLSYVPAANENGAKTFVVRATDSGGASSAPATVTMVLAPGNDAPSLAAVKFDLSEDESITLTNTVFAAKFSDPDAGQSLSSIKLISLPTAGTLTVITNPPGTGTTNAVAGQVFTVAELAQLKYARSANDNGDATFSVTASDGGLSSEAAVVTISVAALNDAPSAKIPTLTLVPVGDTLTNSAAVGLLNFKSVALSPDASKIVAAVDNGTLKVSNDGGLTWSDADAVRNWNSVSMSTNGQVIAATDSRGKIYVSINGGTTWTARENDRQWRSVAVSAQVSTNATQTNAVALIAAVVSGGQVWVSQDSGTNWTRRAVADGTGLTNLLWSSVAVSADGSRLLASVYGGSLYTSADRGTNWTAVSGISGARLWNSVASSRDGLKLAATELGGSIWQSTDGGATWSANAATAGLNWSSVALSADGGRLLAAVNGGKLYRSLNGGTTWTAISGANANWSAVAGSSDLKRAVVAVDGGNLSTTGDYDIPLTITVAEDSGTYTQAGFATEPSVGPANESAQTISYSVGVSGVTFVGGTNLFVGTPTVDAAGALSFTPAPNASGTATLTVTVKDSGGVTNSLGKLGVDSAVVGSFTVQVTAVDDGPVATAQTNVGIVEDVPNNPIILAGVDPEGDAVTNYVVLTLPTKGSLTSPAIGTLNPTNRTLGSNPALNYTPTNHATGADSFTFQVVSRGLTSAAATVGITITNVNDAPVATAQAVTTDEDNAKAITLAGTDVEGSTLTYTVVTPPTKGTLSGTAPALTYTPTANLFGADSFTFKVNDGTVDSTNATVSITINSVNDIPTANSLVGTNAISAIEDSATNFVFALSGSSPEAGKTLTYQVLTLPTKGTLTHSGTNLTRPIDLIGSTNLSYRPAADNFGSDSFTFKVNDGTDNSAPATVAINIANVNDIPSFTIPMTLKPGGDKAAWDIVTNTLGSWNSLAVSSNGSVVIAASATGLGISTNSGASYLTLPATTNSGGYNAVAASADGSRVLVARGTGLFIYAGGSWSSPTSSVPALNWSSVASSADGVRLVAAPSGDKLYVSTNSGAGWSAVGTARDWEAVASSADGTKLAGAVYNGLIYTSTDGGTNWTARGTVNRLWTSIASSADGMKLAATEVNGKIYTSDDGGATWTARDSDRAWSSIAMSADGKVLVAGVLGGRLYYSEDSGASWTAKDSVRVWGTVAISGNGGNAIAAVLDGSLYRAAGYFTESTFTVNEDEATTIAGFATDISAGSNEPNQTVTFVVSNNNTNLFKVAPAISANGTLTFTPADNLAGSALVTVFVQDDGGTALGGVDKSASKTFNITVVPVNDAPVAVAQTVAVVEDTATAITLSGSDAEGSALTYSVVRQPTLGTLTGTAPNLTYTPEANKSGADTFTFKVNDGTLDSSTVTVTIVIAAVNDAPVVAGQAVTTDEDSPVSITLVASDLDGDALTYTIVTAPTKGELTGTAPNLLYVPNPDYAGPDSFTVVVNDGTVDSAPATVSISVAPVNDAPVAGTLVVTTEEDTTAIVTLQGFDAEGSALTYTIVTPPANGVLSGEGASLEYVPNPDFNGADRFTYRVSDGSANSGLATVNIVVTSVADAPVAQSQTVKAVQGTKAAVTLQGFDGDGDTLTYTVAAQPKKGTLTGTAPNLTYTPNADATGTDSFTFRVNDGTSDSAQATVLVVIGEASNISVKSSTANSITLEVRAPKDVVVQVESGTSLGNWSATAIKVTGEGTDTGVPVTLQIDKSVPVRFWRLKELSRP